MMRTTALNILKFGIETAKCHHLRFFYFGIYCLLMVGCGKKIKNSPALEEIQRNALTTDRIFLNSKLYVNGQKVNSKHLFAEDTDLEVTIPDIIRVNEGNAGNNTAVIYFNANSVTEFRYYCIYTGGALNSAPDDPQDIEDGLNYHFDDCYNLEGKVGFYPGYQLTQDNDKAVILELLSADPRYNTTATTELEVRYR